MQQGAHVKAGTLGFKLKQLWQLFKAALKRIGGVGFDFDRWCDWNGSCMMFSHCKNESQLLPRYYLLRDQHALSGFVQSRRANPVCKLVLRAAVCFQGFVVCGCLP